MNEGSEGKGGCQVSKVNLAQCNEVHCHNRSSCSSRLERKMPKKIQKALTTRNSTIRELLAEALGMFILMVRKRWAWMYVSVPTLVRAWRLSERVSTCGSLSGQWFPTTSSRVAQQLFAQQLIAVAQPSALVRLPIRKTICQKHSRVKRQCGEWEADTGRR